MTKSEKRIKAAEEKKRKVREQEILAKALNENGHSISEIAKALGISEGTVRNYISEGEQKSD